MGIEFNDEQMQTLKVVASNAAVDASRMFSKWLKGGVHLKMDDVELIPFQEVTSKAGRADEVSIALALRLEKGLEGFLLFVLSESTAYGLVDKLIKKPVGTTQELDSLGQSALNETANIVGCAYINSLRNSMNVEITPSPPLLIHDMTQSIMDSILMEQAAFQDQSLFIEVEFMHDDKRLDWKFFFLPILSTIKDHLS